jgi:hypothetical protein
MRTPQVAQKCGGSYSQRHPAHSATCRPQPSQNAAAAEASTGPATGPIR